MTNYRQQAEAWVADDPDEQTRAELLAVMNDERALRERFSEPLVFGTAGMRGRLGAGPGRMNRRLVALSVGALCSVLQRTMSDAAARGICIGRDARHGSEDLAQEAIEVALGAGFVVHVLERPAPTPLLAYATTMRSAAAGIVITASHNPPTDNGFKVYTHDGIQIVPPLDGELAAAMQALPSVLGLPRVIAAAGAQSGALVPIDAELERAYRHSLRTRLGARPSPRALRIAYTPLHGVGGTLALKVLADAGFHDVRPVAHQMQPDPDFPTIALPNPEEPGALLDLMALANSCHADVAIAHDPDADRLALCASDGDRGHRMLSGNEMGVLLADYAFERAPRLAKPLMCYSLVSSPMAARIAKSYGARAEVTLTGTKWICSRALDLERHGYHLVCGFEEALGFVLGQLVRDKDGLSAAVLAAQLACACKTAGQTLWDRLYSLYEMHGYHHSMQHSEYLVGPDALARARAVMNRLRTHPPAGIGNREVVARSDLSVGRRWDAAGEHALELPTSDVLVFELADELRVCIRPSGTEPKLKCYFDARTDKVPDESWNATRARAVHTLDGLRNDFLSSLAVPG